MTASALSKSNTCGKTFFSGLDKAHEITKLITFFGSFH